MVARTPEGGRWDCAGCGDCCRLYALGPVEPEIVDALRARDVGAHWAPAAAPWVEARPIAEGVNGYFFTHRDGHCVFLRDDDKCAIHALWGAEAKPGFCREFPFHVVEEPRGTTVIARPSCSNLHHALRDGAPIADQVDGVLALPRVGPHRRFAPGAVPILPDAAVSLDDYTLLEDDALATITDDAGPGVAVARIRAQLASRLRRKWPEPDPRRAAAAAAEVTTRVHRLLAQAAAHPPSGEDPHRVAFVAEAAAFTADAARAIGRDRPLDADTLPYTAYLLRAWLLSKRFQPLGGLAQGLGAWWLGVRVAAAATGADPVSRDALGPAIVHWTKISDHPAVVGALRMAAPALWEMFLHAA